MRLSILKLIVFGSMLLGLPGILWAGPVAVDSELVSGGAENGTINGDLQVVVNNLTSGDLQNVDVRLADPSALIENSVYQLGAIPGTEARVTTGNIIVSESALAEGSAIEWIVDYDDADGNHHQTTIIEHN